MEEMGEMEAGGKDRAFEKTALRKKRAKRACISRGRCLVSAPFMSVALLAMAALFFEIERRNGLAGAWGGCRA